MSIILTPEQEQFIRDQMARGRFKSPDELLDRAFKLLEEKYQEYESWIEVVRQQVDEAAVELDRGEGIPLETVMEQLQDKFRQAKGLGN
ncbi:ribbon-helix-helix domain-containing protein [Aerosakkonema funiforme]|uniref:ribbon-helix-helix domain-containing protein n=1 Tax=Aerosakkonema funiforme TaxID=1246630 RepID=UPI0035B75297